ncbi:MAG: hypothetical protein HC808_11225 [Candidatus Competibacteraceae bacterium]|nr:hypothetical protein [Candidatus Competibacteraceae bacterium]
MDKNGNPTIDADFIDAKTKKRRSLKGARKDAHHTSSEKDMGRTYTWEFKSYRRPFKVLICWIASVALTTKAGVSFSVEVIRATDKGPR